MSGSERLADDSNEFAQLYFCLKNLVQAMMLQWLSTLNSNQQVERSTVQNYLVKNFADDFCRWWDDKGKEISIKIFLPEGPQNISTCNLRNQVLSRATEQGPQLFRMIYPDQNPQAFVNKSVNPPPGNLQPDFRPAYLRTPADIASSVHDVVDSIGA